MALVVGAGSLVTTYVILKHDIDRKLEEQAKAATLIANQIKLANLNAILAFTDPYYIFVLHHRDWRVLFESGKRQGGDLKVWEDNSTKILNQILSSQSGSMTYPYRESWEILARRKHLEYRYLPELDWVVAMELPASVTLSELLAVYKPVSIFILTFFSFAFALYLHIYRRREEVPFSDKYAESLHPSEEGEHDVYSEEYV